MIINDNNNDKSIIIIVMNYVEMIITPLGHNKEAYLEGAGQFEWV